MMEGMESVAATWGRREMWGSESWSCGRAKRAETPIHV